MYKKKRVPTSPSPLGKDTRKKLSRLYRRSLAAFAVALTATALVPAQPASAAPVIDSSVAPQAGPTAGGTPIRIYGSGFTGVNDVEIENRNVTKYKFVDDTLITAVVPSALNGTADNNTFADVEVTTTGGTTTAVDAFYYTNATFTVTGANPPFDAGDAITTTLDNYKPNTNFVLPQFNPLLVYIEKFPAFNPPVPPPYTEILVFESTTDANGDKTVNTNLANPFDGSNNSNPVYDANIACPVNQTTANYLGNSASASLDKPAYSGKCMIANGQYGSGTLERAIDMTNDLTPAAATLVLGASSVSRGSSVSISGVNWNANPFFGSSKQALNPGETTVTAQICNSTTNTCSTNSSGNVMVDMSRYIYNTTTGVFDFSGANIHGGIAAGFDLPSPCTTCFVRVTQNRPASGSSPIIKETAININ